MYTSKILLLEYDLGNIMLWKIYTSLIVKSVIGVFIVGGMNFWQTFWGSPGFSFTPWHFFL